MRKLVIIPTYLERENVSAMIDKVFSLPEAFDLLVIDDASPDGTADIVRGRQAEFPFCWSVPANSAWVPPT